VILDDTPNGAGLKNIVQERMLYKDNPFTKTLSCLQDQSSVGAIPMDTNSIAQKIKNKQMKMIRLGQDNSQNNDYKFVDFSSKNQQEFLDYFQGCNIEGDIRTQLQEAFADKVAAEIMAKKLSQLSVKDAATSINEIILSYGNLCSSQGLGEREYYNFGVKQDCPDYFENVTTQERILTSLKIVNKFDPHPDPVIRIQNNLLAHPLIRKSLNCETAKGVKFCE
jgi:hypothetical protein